MARYTETLYDAWGQEFSIDEVYFEHKTDHQHLMIFNNALFGRVMALDGVIQTTERDEFVYHEMMAHVPILAHGNAKRVLIVGGGDGGMLREVLRHSSVEQVTQVEIDQAVIDMSIEFLPNHSQGAYDDPRANIVIADGIEFIRQCQDKFDVIISDSTDPIGPGEVLFTSEFYENANRCLTDGGILATQNGVAFMQPDEVITTAKRLSNTFADWSFYTAAVPTYVGGIMTFAWGCNDESKRKVSLDEIKRRFEAAKLTTRYYNPDLHYASFLLPTQLQTVLHGVPRLHQLAPSLFPDYEVPGVLQWPTKADAHDTAAGAAAGAAGG